RVRRTQLRRRRLRLAGGADGAALAAHAAWDELLATLVDLDIDHRSSDTPRGIAARLTRARPVLVENSVPQVDALTRAVERASYARQPLPDAELVPAVRQVTAELAATVTGLAKLRGWLFPASVTQRWRGAATDFGERTAAGWTRLGDAVGQRVPGRDRATRRIR
ncbi:MAG: DUF4129 domain-containing protein, partial [Micromonosporaceae bacterium]